MSTAFRIVAVALDNLDIALEDARRYVGAAVVVLEDAAHRLEACGW